ncbi:MAG: GTP cyclohydrolase I FolE [Lachnospiraceae bacterium]|nr:GTP cyclohydrolase I FolE [Lachnospiraceae bacterium]
MDSKKIEQGVRLILEGIGEDPGREGLKGTPGRISRMYEEIFGGLDKTPQEFLATTFGVDNDEMVIEKDITFYSMCEHHLLPFYGKASVAYIPDGKVVGLSKLARTVDLIARKPQIQEKMTAEVADALMEYLKPKGAIVVIKAEHMCMTMRGIKKPGSTTVTMASRGVFETDKELKDDFFRLLEQ